MIDEKQLGTLIEAKLKALGLVIIERDGIREIDVAENKESTDE